MSKTLTKSEQETLRGVINPRVVDLIQLGTDCVELLMFEERRWLEEGSAGLKEQLEQLEDKLNNYLDYVLDGFFRQQYIEYVNKPVKFVLVCRDEPTGVVEDLLGAFANYARTAGIGFERRCL